VAELIDIIFNAEKSCLCKIGKVTNKHIDELFIGHRQLIGLIL